MLLWKYLKFCQGTGCEIPQNRRLTNDRTQQRREITLGVHCGQVEHQGLFLCAGVPPVAISHGNFLLFVTSLTRPVSAACRRTYSLITHHSSLKSPVALPGGNRCTAQSLPGHWGVPRHRRGGGIPRVTGFHIGLYHEEVPAVNPSVASGANSQWPGAFFTFPVDFFPGIGYTGVNQLNACLIV